MNTTFTYVIGNNLYINLTNRCSNRCTFCVREGNTFEGYDLRLTREPSAEEVIEEIGDPTRYREIVFCGYGEPTCRLDALLAICDAVHAKGGKTRLNTNGHGSLLAGRDIVPLLAGRVDFINVSLNTSNASRYQTLCRPLIDGAFEGMLAFARRMKECGISGCFSIVDCVGEEEIARCRAVAESVGLPLRVRPMIEV